MADETLGWCPRLWAQAAASGPDCPWQLEPGTRSEAAASPHPTRQHSVRGPAHPPGQRSAHPPTGYASLKLADELVSPGERTAALDAWAHSLLARGLLGGWRGERVRVHDALGQVVFALERALLRPLGLPLRSVQAAVYTHRADGTWLWVAQRAHTKPVDPGLFDVLVAGGIAGDLDHEESAWETLLRECAEEAGLPSGLAEKARRAGEFDAVCLDRLAPSTGLPEALPVLHRETLLSYWLEVPPDFEPRAVDGEHQAIVAMRPQEVLASIGAGGWCREGAMLTERVAKQAGGFG